MLSVLIGILAFFVIIFLLIAGGNFLLSGMIDHFLDGQENFENIYEDKNIELNDECSKIDLKSQEILNFQTGTNIPLSPINYSDYVGDIHIIKDSGLKNDKKINSKLSLKKPVLLYDGIWKSDMKYNDEGYEHQYWNLTNGNIGMDEYWSDDLIRINKKIPNNYIDKTAVCGKGKNIDDYLLYCNDTVYDVEDTELSCFPQIFTAGMPLDQCDN